MPCATAVILDPSAREGGSFRPPPLRRFRGRARSNSACADVSGDRWFLNCILCQQSYCFRSLFGISILLVDLFRDFYIGTGFLVPQIAPEPPPGRDIAGGSQKVARLPLQQYAGCQSCYRPKYQKSLVFAPVTGRRMLILLMANTKRFRPPPPGTPRTLPGRSPDAPGIQNRCFS